MTYFRLLKLSSVLFIFIGVSSQILLAEVTKTETKSSSSSSVGGESPVPTKKQRVQLAARCGPIKSRIEAVLGPGHVACYINLFQKESSCRHRLPQAKGTAGNPHAGFGLCTIETSAALRKKRGPNCRAATPDNIDAQILCCRDMMVATNGRYFSPVKRGETPKCN